ncbi:MAG: ABC transporter ATP-binding protein [Lewinella sp.]
MPPAIELRGLRKSYYQKPVLFGLDLIVEPGQIVGYIGPNGAGKTTTLRILGGLDNRFDGEVRVLGRDVKKDPLAVKRRIGYLPESADLYDVLTPREFYELVGSLHEMEEQRIHDRAARLEQYLGLSYRGNQRMDSFSKGMRQKVLLTSILLHDPDLIFMDEPLNGLDANSVIRVKDLLRQLADRGKTIFYSSHIMDVVERISDRIILLNDGRIAANGTFAELNAQAHSSNLENLFTQLTGGRAGGEGPRFSLDADE